MAGVDWKINGLSLESALGLVLTSSSAWRSPASMRRSPITIPGAHGQIEPSLPIFDAPQVGMEAWAIASSPTALEGSVSQFTALASSPSLMLGRDYGGVATTAVAKLVSIDHSAFIPGSASRISMLFAIPGTFFRAAAWTSADLAFAADLTMAELSGLSGSTAPIGDATIRVTGPATSVTVTDPTTGAGITWSGSLAAGQYLFMRPRPLSARISSLSSEWTSGGTDVSTGLDFPAAGRLQLWPVVQSATVRKVLINATGDGRTTATKLAVQAQGAYL